MPIPQNFGKLFIVATPIGNPKDITMRALDILKKADTIICEEIRIGSRLLRQLNVENTLTPLNEHNEAEEAPALLNRLVKGETLAIISDAGTPIFADPGQRLLELCYQAGVQVSPVPGPASLMAALSLCDFPIEQFVFAGFPPRKTEQRTAFLRRYLSVTVPVILMDTPYRMTKLLEEVQLVFGQHQDLLLACDLTLQKESIYRGEVGMILPRVTGQKREFILILNLNPRKRTH